jgi:HAD superfamily hydrolase (TIGR01493 family)
VLFDFHQTLFQVEDNSDWIRAAADMCDIRMTDDGIRTLRRVINEKRSDPDVLALQKGRDRSPAAHRRATTGWLRLAGVAPPMVDALYERLRQPEGWHPYTDTEPTLRRLAAMGVSIGVVSNTGWDLRETFRHYDLADYISTYVLSCEHGIEKPDPKLFLIASEAVGARPGETLMVGDNPDSDGGAVAAGMTSYLLPGAPPHTACGLTAVLRLAGVAG